MSRYVHEISIEKSAEEAEAVIRGYLEKKGFVLKEYGDGPEMVWQKGTGWVAAPKFVTATVRPGAVKIEAWVRFAWQPGVYSREMAPKGFLGFTAKRALRKKVANLERRLAG